MDFDDDSFTTVYERRVDSAAPAPAAVTARGGASLGRIALVRASAVAGARHAGQPVRTIGFKR